MSKLHLNPAFDPALFLQKQWQAQPLLIPQLVPGFQDLISPEELAGLACENDIESRLVRGSVATGLELMHGPIAEAIFTSLPESDWTVLVQAVDHWVEEVATLRGLFEFIPRWRIDDVMVSFAADNGGVGPHFDHYDVFLLQGSGQRRWQLGDKVADDIELSGNGGLAVMQDFKPLQEFVLNPGDALYIPPRFAHWGQSIGDSTCYSIGFRAPSLGDMIEGFSDILIAGSKPFQRYRDRTPSRPITPARIEPEVITAAYDLLQSSLDSPLVFSRWFGCHVTQLKYVELREPLTSPLSTAEFVAALAAGERLHHDPGSRFAFLRPEQTTDILWFVDGECFEFTESYSEVIQKLCEPTIIPTMSFSQFEKTDPLLELVIRLLNQGSLELY